MVAESTSTTWSTLKDAEKAAKKGKNAYTVKAELSGNAELRIAVMDENDGICGHAMVAQLQAKDSFEKIDRKVDLEAREAGKAVLQMRTPGSGVAKVRDWELK